MRLDRLPAASWAAAGLAALAALFAFTTSASAAVLMVLAAAATYWALRERQRFVISSSHDDQIALVDLAGLAPLLEALPDPALLIDAESKIVGSNAAARRQMHF